MTSTQPRSFGQLLQRYRRAAAMTQEQLAQRAGLSARAISDLERGVNHTPRRDTVLLLAEALDLQPAEHSLFTQTARQPAPASTADTTAAAAAATSGVQAAAPTNLPQQALEFFGREGELSALRQLLPGARLLTLTGPGGIGKTQLALALGRSTRADFADGVFCVELAAISDARLVTAAVAETLEVSGLPGRPLLDALRAHLASRQMLLILDNFEQVLDAALLADELLLAAPRLSVLITSRAPLRLRQEQEFPVSPLALPGAKHLAVDELLGFAAIQLFVSRAALVKPDFALTAENCAAVAEICMRLDGLPLAIELAAARIRVLTPQAILQRLSSRLNLLTGGARNQPARQQTLRAALAWSYDLLSTAEQGLFARLAVFAAGATLPAIQAVCKPEHDLGIDALEGVDSLVTKSLLRVASGGEQPASELRYTMLENICEYAQERLAADTASNAQIRERHSQYFLSVARDQAAALAGLQAARALQLLSDEFDNVHEAWQWAAVNDKMAALSEAMEAVALFCDLAGRYVEGEELFRRAAEAIRAQPEGTPRATLLGSLVARQALFSARQGQLARGQGLLEESRAILLAVNAPNELAYVLDRLGAVVAQRGYYAQARLYHEQSLALARQTANRHAEMQVLNTLGLDATKLGAFAEAEQRFNECLALARALNDQRMVGRTLNYLGYAFALTGDAARAQPPLRESLALADRLNDTGLLAYIIGSMGEAEYAIGAWAEARRLTEDSLARADLLGDRMLQAYARLRLGAIAWSEGDAIAAEGAWRAGLATALEIGAVPRMLSAIVGIALIAAARGDNEHAARLCRAALDHPAIEAVDRARAERCLRLLASTTAHAGLATSQYDQVSLLGPVEAVLGRRLLPEEITILIYR